jgi:branched-chain amino acid transport system permease protein
MLIFAIFAMSLNLIAGYTGLPSLGHAAFFGVGGYTSGILMLRYGIKSFWLIAPAGVFVSVLVAAIFGLVALRVSGLYFLMVTFALAQLLYAIAWNWFRMTGGAHGLVGVTSPELGLPWITWDVTFWYFFVLGTFIICYVLMYQLVRSPLGHAFQGIREHEPRMRALGYNTWLYKYIAFIIGAVFAGIAGILFVHWNKLIAPMHLGIETSVLGFLIIIIGGAGTLFGPVVGAAVLIFAEYQASIYSPERWPLILGIIFVITVVFLRGGIYPRFIKLWAKVERSSFGSAKG